MQMVDSKLFGTQLPLQQYKKLWMQRKRGYVAPQEKPCVICAKAFTPPTHHPRSQTCSRPCSKKLEYRNHKESYIARAGDWQKSNRSRFNEIEAGCRARKPELYRAIWRNKQNRRRSYFPKDGDFTAVQWIEIVAQQKGCCWWCGLERKLTIDHVIPVIRGGKHTKSNIVGSCKPCNSTKRDKIWPLEAGKLANEAVWMAVGAQP